MGKNIFNNNLSKKFWLVSKKPYYVLLTIIWFSFPNSGIAQCTGCTTTVGTNTAVSFTAANQTICINSNTYSSNITNPGNFANSTVCFASNVNWTGGSVSYSGTPTGINIYGTASATLGTIGTGVTVNVNSTATFTGSTTLAAGGTLNVNGVFNPSSINLNSGGGVLNVSNTGTANINPGSIATTINNQGNLVFPGAVTFVAGGSNLGGNVVFQNSLTFGNGSVPITISGNVTVAGGNAVVINGSLNMLSGSSLTVVNGNVTIGAATTFAGAVNINGNLTNNNTLTLQGGSTNVTGTIYNTSTLTGGNSSGGCGLLCGSTITGWGAYNVGSGLSLCNSPIGGSTPDPGVNVFVSTTTSQPQNLTIASTTSGYLGTFSIATNTGTNGYIVVRNAGSQPAAPISFTSYSPGSVVSGSTIVAAVISPRTVSSFIDIQPSSCGTKYYYAIYAYQTSTSTGTTCGNLFYINTLSPSTATFTPQTIGSIGSITGSVSVCPNIPTNYSISSISGVSGYLWGYTGNGVSVTSTSTSASLTFNSTATSGILTVVGFSSCTTTSGASLNLTANTVTSILTQPVSQSLCPGNSATFTVSATGTGTLSYRWLKGGGTIAGTNSSITFTNISSTTAGIYTVSVTGQCGTVLSSGATLTVNTSTSILTQPVSQSSCQGTSVTFTVSATGSGTLGYQWLKNGATISGSSSSLSFSNISSTTAGAYTVSVTGLCGTVLSSTANLTVNPTTSILVQPQNLSNCVLLPITLSVSATGTNLNYLWSNGVTTSSETTTQALPPYTIVYVVTVSGLCGTVISNPATANWGLSPTPSVSISSSSVNNCQGTPVTFTAVGVNGGTTPSYSWYINNILTTLSGIYVSYIPNNNDIVLATMQAGGTICPLLGGPATSNGISISVVSTATSSITLTSSTTTGCSGSTISFTATGVNTGSSPNYGWYVGNSLLTSTGTTFSYIPTNGNIVKSVLTIGGSGTTCIKGSPTTSSGITLSVIPFVTPTISILSSSNGTCSGSLITFTAAPSNGGNSPSYQWKLNGINIGSGAQTYATNTLLNTDIVSVILTANNTCQTTNTVTSSSVNIPITASGAWLGNTSDWNTASNWCGGIPTSNTSVTIGITSNNPIISLADATCSSISISSTAGLTISNSHSLFVYGNFINNGTFTPNTGTVRFGGSSAQAISGSGVNLFYNIGINNTAGVTLGNTISVSGTMTLGTNAKYSSGGATTVLLSTSTANTARLAAVPSGATFSGNITMQRYVPAVRTLRFMSSAVNGSTIADWKRTIPITGIGGAANGFDPVAGGIDLASVWSYNEAYNGPTTYRFVEAPNTALGLNVGAGYKAFIMGDRGTYTFPIAVINPTPCVVSVTNPPNIGTISLPVTYHNYGAPFRDGFNFVGNPYPCEIDWDSPNWVKTNINNAIYQLDPEKPNGGAYYSYVGGVVSDGRANPNIIASSQGFFVKASTTPGLVINETVKVVNAGNTGNFREAPNQINDLLRLRFTDNAGNSDYAVVRFRAGSTAAFEGDYDALKISNTHMNISSNPTGTLPLSINTMDYQGAVTYIPLSVSAASPGSYSILASGLGSFADSVSLSLQDNYLGSSQPVAQGFSYPFQVTPDANSSGTGRFVLVATVARQELVTGTANSGVAKTGIKVYPNPNNGTSLTIDFYNFNKGNIGIIVRDISGNTVISSSTNSDGNGLFSFELPGFANLSSGIYIISAASDDVHLTSKVAVTR